MAMVELILKNSRKLWKILKQGERCSGAYATSRHKQRQFLELWGVQFATETGKKIDISSFCADQFATLVVSLPLLLYCCPFDTWVEFMRNMEDAVDYYRNILGAKFQVTDGIGLLQIYRWDLSNKLLAVYILAMQLLGYIRQFHL